VAVEALHEPPRHRGPAADPAAQAREVGPLLVGEAQEVAQDRRDAGDERRPLGGDRPRERRGGDEAVGHDEPGSRHRGREGQAPGVDVEHRHDDDHAVGAAEADRVGQAHPGRVQGDGAVGVQDALWVARRPARVAEGRRGALVDLGPVEVTLAGLLEELLVAQGAGQAAVVPVPHHDEAAHAGEAGRELREGGRERVVDEDDPVLGVVDDVLDLLREQPDVDRVQHRAEARDGEVELEVALGVPAEGRDPVPRSDAQALEDPAQPLDALADLGVGRPGGRRGILLQRHDLPVPVARAHPPADRPHRELEVVLHESLEHGLSSSWLAAHRVRPVTGRTRASRP
jgi:hypothetical protein